MLDRCEAKSKEWAKHWQCDESVQNLEDKPWKNEELKQIRGSLAQAERVRMEKSFEIVQGENRSRMRWPSPKHLFGFGKRNKRRNRGVFGESGAEWEMAAASLHNDVLSDSEECHQ